MNLSGWMETILAVGAAAGLAAVALRKIAPALTFSRHFQRVGEINVSDLLVAFGSKPSPNRGKLEIAVYLTVRRSPAERAEHAAAG